MMVEKGKGKLDINIEEEYYSEGKTLLAKLIACDTTAYNESNGQYVVKEYLERIGYDVKEVKVNPKTLALKYPEFNSGHTYENRNCLVLELKGLGGGKSIIINSHIDTVFPANLDLWTSNPFQAVEKDGKLFGLGTSDMKGGLVAVLIALKLLKDNGVFLKGDLIFQSVVDEEAGGGNGTLACIEAGYVADGVIVTEPTELLPACAHVGSCAVKLLFRGKSAHANLKQKGVSAFEKSLPVLEELYRLGSVWKSHKHEILPTPNLSVVLIKAGDGSITLPSTCEVVVNFTYLPGSDDYYSDFLKIIEKFNQEEDWFIENPIEVEEIHNVKPYSDSQDNEFVLEVINVVSDVLKSDIKAFGMGTGTDARLFSNIKKMKTVILGPGSIELAHSPNEYIEIEQFNLAIQVYFNLICSWCGVANYKF